MDPVHNPFAPGAGQRPPELAGRDRELDAFDVLLERVARGRPERSLVLTGLRGVGKTVMLGELRSRALGRGWATGKVEAKAGAALRRPLSAALHRAVRDLAVRHRAPDRVDDTLGVLKAFALKANPEGTGMRDKWQPGIDVPATRGRADSGDIEIDLVELFACVADLAADVGTGLVLLLDEMQDLGPDDVSALCAACHELSQSRSPLVVVGAGLPHVPSVLSASKSYSERLFRYLRIDRLDPDAAERAVRTPIEREGSSIDDDALAELYTTSGGYPYFVQAYGKAAWDAAPGASVTAGDVAIAAPEAEAELAVGFFGSRLERATPAEREYLHAMAELGRDQGATTELGRDRSATTGSEARGDAVATARVAEHLGRRASSLSPARDGLLKKGLIYATERGFIAFTVPHFGRFLVRSA